MFETGKAYMVCLGFGWVLVGRCVGPAGVFAYRFERCSYVVNTGGTPWGELAAGKGQRKAVTKPVGLNGTALVGTQIVWACEWEGKVPGEQ